MRPARPFPRSPSRPSRAPTKFRSVLTEQPAGLHEQSRRVVACRAHNGQRVGTIGITGDPAVVRSAARVAAHVAQAELERLVQREQLRTTALDGFQSVRAAAEQILAGTADHLRLGDQLEQATGELLQRTQQTVTSLRVIQELAQRATMLGINAAIEAAHAGHTGQGFTVVADEVRRMAERTRASATEIQQSLSAWQLSFDEMAGHVSATAQVAREQADSIRSITEQIMRIEAATAGLVEG
jgi:methyl-accepting chemotaxis protein